MNDSLIRVDSFSGGKTWDKIDFFEVSDYLPVGVAFLNQDFIVERFNKHYSSYIENYSPLSISAAKGSSYFSMVPGSDRVIAHAFKAVRENKVPVSEKNAPLYVDHGQRNEITFWNTDLVPVTGLNGDFKGILLITQEVEGRSGVKNTEQHNIETLPKNSNKLFNTTLAKEFKLTYREIQVANNIVKGKTSKEIADALCVSTACIEFHRTNIRKKLGIKNTGTNLSTFLMALDPG